jgi:hypothetical protein
MAEKKKSIIEEALLEAKSLEDALKANTKEMLAAHLSKELDSIVESSLKGEKEEVSEQEDEEMEMDDIEIEGSDDEEDVELDFEGEESEDDEDIELDLDSEESEKEVDLDLDTDLDLDAGEGEMDVDLDLELPSMGMDDEEGEEVMDLTGASDEEVVKVFKRLSDDDEVEVVKDSEGIHLKDNQTGAEYYIKESMDRMYSMEEGEYCSECGSGSMYEDYDELGEEVVYEIELEDNSPMMEMSDDVEEGAYIDEEEDPIEEDLARTRGGARQGNRRHGASHIPSRREGYRFDESKRERNPIINRKPKTSTVSENKILKEYTELKAKNEEYKKALNVFKDKLNEVALFNTNLAYVNRLFTEHSTTKKEKMGILKRFDNAESIKESKNIYKTIKTELDNKNPINESVEKKVNKTIESSKSTNLNESTAYVDPQITAIKDLMRRIS